MVAFSYNQQQHPTFVLDSFLVPDTSNNMHRLFHDNAQTTATITEACFPSMLLPDHHSYQYLQEIPVLPQIHETSTVQLSCTTTSTAATAGPSFTVKHDSVSSAMVGGLAGGEHQLSVQVGFSSMEKKTESMETKVERVGKGDEKEGKYCGNPRKAEVRKEKRVSKKQKRIPAEVPSGFVHVRARRGQATDSHSLAERVRRQKISMRMKLLQSLVPGCDKITGKALILDEIIKYVKTLQSQVEYLTAELASVYPIIYGFDLDFNTNTLSREKTSSFDFQLPPFVESSSTQFMTSFPEKMATLDSQMFPHDLEESSHISFQAHYL